MKKLSGNLDWYAIIVLIIQNYTQDITQTIFRENVSLIIFYLQTTVYDEKKQTFNLMQCVTLLKLIYDKMWSFVCC